MYAEFDRQGRMNLDELISKQISPGEVNEGYAALSGPGSARVVITAFSNPRHAPPRTAPKRQTLAAYPGTSSIKKSLS